MLAHQHRSLHPDDSPLAGGKHEHSIHAIDDARVVLADWCPVDDLSVDQLDARLGREHARLPHAMVGVNREPMFQFGESFEQAHERFQMTAPV